METKFIITKDGKHFKSNWLHHDSIARNAGYSFNDVIECGMFLDKQLFILDCKNSKHLEKKNHSAICGRLNFYQDMRFERIMKGRECESRSMYKYAGLPAGD